MDDIIEFGLEILFEIISAATESKEVPSVVRKLLLGILFGAVFAVAILLLLVGKEEGNAVIMSVAAIMMICIVVVAFRKIKKS